MKAGVLQIILGISFGALGLFATATAAEGSKIGCFLFFAIIAGICLTIGFIKNKNAIRNDQIAREKECKQKWIHAVQVYRFQTWMNTVKQTGSLVACDCTIPDGFICHNDEIVFLTNRYCNLYESQNAYKTSMAGGFSAASSSYTFSKSGINKSLYGGNPLLGSISDMTTLTGTSGQYAGMATTISYQKRQLVSTGMLIVTNRRVIFLGNHQNRVFNIADIISCNGDESHLAISTENYDKVSVIEAFDVAIFCTIINMLHANIDMCEQYDVPVISLPRDIPKTRSNKVQLVGRRW